MMTAGPIRYRGIKHYGGFFNRGLVMQRLHVPAPYPGDAVIYASEDSSASVDFTGWRQTLIGTIEFVSVRETTTRCCVIRTSTPWRQTLAGASERHSG